MTQVDEERRVKDAAARLNRSLLTLSRCNRVLCKLAASRNLLQSICQILVKTAGLRLVWIGTAKMTPRKLSVRWQAPATVWITWNASRSLGAIRAREKDRSAMPSGQESPVGLMTSARTMGEPRLWRLDMFPVLHFRWPLMWVAGSSRSARHAYPLCRYFRQERNRTICRSGIVLDLRCS
jgi:hypothetical protein